MGKKGVESAAGPGLEPGPSEKFYAVFSKPLRLGGIFLKKLFRPLSRTDGGVYG
jgi:hypothetical protein